MKAADKKNENQTDKVDAFMAELNHLFKAEIEAVRTIIKNADSNIKERIKWNAPSFFFKEDMATFNPRNIKFVQLVFHHPKIVNIKSALLLGDYKDRRLAHFNSMAEVNANKTELERIFKELVLSQQ